MRIESFTTIKMPSDQFAHGFPHEEGGGGFKQREKTRTFEKIVQYMSLILSPLPKCSDGHFLRKFS